MLLKIDNHNAVPIYRQIVNQIKALVDHGMIEVGNALPSTRSLAESLGVNRSTISKAYDELKVLGYLNSRPGSYNIIQKRRKEAKYYPDRKCRLSWKDLVTDSAERTFQNFLCNLADIPTRTKNGDGSMIDLSELHLDPNLFPVEDLRRSYNKVLIESGSEALDFCPPEGNRNFREYIAQRLRLHGISTSYEEILITYGSQQALDLIIRMLARSEKKVVVEAPTYFNILPLLEFQGIEVLSIPMRDDGMDLDYLENLLAAETVSFVYTIPNFHNPTGIVTSHQHRERLLNICLQHDVPIVEDGFEEEMKYSGTVPLPIKSIDEHNIVIYVGTFSKILCPGVRVGWITADKGCIARLVAVKRCSDLRCSNLTQSAMYQFCKSGYYDMHIKRLHRVFRRRMEVALETIEKSFPDKASWTQPQGGYLIWVKIPKRLTGKQLSDFMAQHGIIVSPGSYYFADRDDAEYFRVSISRLGEDEIREGFSALGRVLHNLC